LGSSGLTITGLHKTGNVTGNGYDVGGLVGFQTAIVSNSDSAGTVTNSAHQNSTGGLFGYTDSNITNSWSSGQVNTSHGNYAGGLVGYISGSPSIIDSYSTATVTGSNTNYVGGLAGHFTGVGTLIRSYATGTVSGANYIGGLLGSTGNYFNVYNSYFSGTSVTGGGERVGGLIGHAGLGANVYNSYVTASLIQGSYRVGGLVGSSGWGTNISSDSSNGYTPIRPYSSASVNATSSESGFSRAGGLVGEVGHAAYVTDAYMTGSYVKGPGSHVGGLIGYTSTDHDIWILRSHASGTTLNGSNYVGGLTANLSSGAIVNSYFSGTITGPSGVASSLSTEYGGLAGYMKPGAVLSNSYYNIDTSLIKGEKMVTPGGIYNTQYAEWEASNAVVASRSINIANYFSAPVGGYYSISTVSDAAVQAAASNDLTKHSDFSNMLGFVQSSNNGTIYSMAVNGYKFKLANDIDMSAATIPYVPYFGATEFKGNGFAVNNFSFNRPTSQIGFIGLVNRGTITDLLVNSVVYAGQTGTSYAVNGRNYTGTAIGSVFEGVVTGSTATLAGGVNGLEFTGGFTGWARGAMANTSAVLAASSIATVKGTSYTGGLVGRMDSVAANTLSSNLAVSGTHRVGGLAGYLSSNYTSSNAAVTTNTATNLHATGNVTGTDERVGGLIGESTGGTLVLSNSSATGSVTGSYYYVGGLVGVAYGTGYSNLLATGAATLTGGERLGGLIGWFSASSLTNAEARGVVTGQGTSGNYVGGLVGFLDSNATVADSRFTTGSVTGKNSYVGGLVGWAASGTSIKGSYSTQAVTGTNDFVGGLVGKLAGSIMGSANSPALANGSAYSYATGSVTGRYDVGGLVGRADDAASITDAYSTGSVTANRNFGGLLGYLTPGAKVTNSHYDINAVSITGFTPASPSTRVAITGQVTIGGLYAAQYTDWYNSGALNGLVASNTTKLQSYFGDPDANSFYSLSTTVDLKNYLGYADQTTLKFKLGASIDMASAAGPDMATAAGLYIPYVAGAFDPNGKTISNLALSQYTSSLGFIGHLRGVDTTTALAGLTVTSAAVVGQTNVGAAVGSAYRRALTTPFTSGSVSGSDIVYSYDPSDDNNGRSNVGGVIGYALASGNSTAVLTGGGRDVVASTATVSGATNTGGLIGRIATGALTAASSNANVTGSVRNTGGLVGRSANSTIYNVSYTTGLVRGVDYVGGLVGLFNGNVGETAAPYTTASPTYTTFVTSNVEASGNYVGGMLGSADGGSVVNAAASGTVTGLSGGYAGSYTGGLIGQSNMSVTYTKYTGLLVKGGHRTGGLVGSNDSNTIFNSFVSAGAANSSAVMGNSSLTGGLAGYSYYYIDNTYSNATVTGTAGTVGGLVGQAHFLVTNSQAYGNVVGSSNSTGGLIGHSYATVNSSTASGAVSGGSYVGGLVGYAEGGAINSSSASSSVNATGERVGGLVGQLNVAMGSSNATGNVVASGNYVGGLVGLNYSNITTSTSTGNVYSSSNQVGGLVGGHHGGTITSSSASITTTNATTGYGVSGNDSVGGLVGWSQSDITGSTAFATVKASNYAGGFVGWLQSATISSSGTNGNVTGLHEVGGFVGRQSNGSINTSYANNTVSSTQNATSGMAGGFVGLMDNGTITSSRAAGAVTGFGLVGGFAGNVKNSSGITQSYATGTATQNSTSVLTATQTGTGGFVGYMDSSFTGTISDVYAMGAVRGTSRVGGLVGYADRGNISNAYATGHVSSSNASTSVGAVFGAVNTGFVNNVNGALRVVPSNLYWDNTTSNQTVDATGGGGVAIATEDFKNVLPAGLVSPTWEKGAGLYPYLKVFYPTTPRSIDGIASLSSGAVAVRGQVTQYSNNGTLLNGGSASTGVNGYYYSLVGSNTLFTDSAIAESVESISLVSGGNNNYNYLPTPTLTGGGGTGATATVTRAVDSNGNSTSMIGSVTLGNAGSGYTSAPTVTLSGGGTGASFSVALFTPRFLDTKLATTLTLDGGSNVAGMAYTDLLVPDASFNLTRAVTQGLTQLSTGAASVTALNTDMDTTIGAAKRATFSSTLPTMSSLELTARAATFNVNTPITYADNGLANAGLVTVTGTQVTLSNGNVTSSKTQNYNTALTLGANATLTGTTVTTSSTLAGASYSLTVAAINPTDGSGNLTTGGNSTGLSTLTVARNTVLGGNVASTGNQTYGGTVVLNTDLNMAATGTTAVISVAGTVNSDATSPRALVVNASGATSNVVLGGSVGVTAPLTSLAITASDIDVNGGTVTTQAAQTFTGPVTLGANTTLNGVAITLGGTVVSSGGNRSLLVNDSGTTTLTGAIGGSTDAEKLSSLTTDAGGNTLINGGAVRTTGVQTYGDAVTLGANTTLSGVAITLGSTVVSSGGNRSLLVNDSGTTTLTGAIGGSTDDERLASLTTDAGGSTAINGGSVRSSGAQTYGDALSLGTATTLAGTTLTTLGTVAGNANALTITGNAVLGDGAADTVTGLTTLSVSGTTAINNSTITSTGAQTYTGAVTLGENTTLSGVAITLGSTVVSSGGNRSLLVNDSGTTTLTGAIGGSTDLEKLSSLTTDADGNTLINGGAVRTTGAQTYGDAVTLGVATTLAGSTLTTLGTVAGNANALTITGNAVLGDGAADTVTGLTTLSVSGTTAINTHTVTSTGAQTYTGAVSLGANTTLSGVAIALGDTVKSDGTNRSLAINDSGTTTLSGAIGGSGATGTDGERLVSLTTDAGGSTAINGGSVRTTAAQTYGDAVTLGANTTLSGVAITLGSTVVSSGGNRSLLVNDSGTTTLTGAIGGSTDAEKLISLTTDAGGNTLINGGAVRTTDAQTYGDAVSLGVATTLAGTTLTTLGTVAGNANALTITGNAVLGDGAADTVTGLTTLSVSGTTAINTHTITSTGAQTYTGAVTLGENTTLSGVAIALGDTVKSDGTNRSLLVNDSGTTTLSGAIGGTSTAGEKLSSITTDAAGTTAINGGSITTTGAQTFNDAVTLGADTTLTGVGVTLASTLVSSGANNRSLTINDSGTTTLGSAVGSATALEKLSSLTTDAAGTTAINGGSITTTGTQTFNDAVTLGLDTTLSGVGITLGSTVKSDGTNRSLAINDSGATTLGGAIGSATAGEKLSSITTDVGGTTAINGGGISTDGSQTFNDALTLGAPTTLSATDAGAVITTASTINSDSASTPRALTLTASGGNVVLGGPVGAAAALSSLAVTASDIDLNGSAVTTTTGQTYTGPVTLGASTVLTGVGIMVDGTVMSNGTARSLSIVDSGSTVLSGAVGGSALGEELISLTTNAGGSTTMNGGSVRTSGSQSFGDALTLGNNTTLAASDAAAVITLASSVNSASTTTRALTVTAAGAGGNVVLGSTVGATHALSSLAVTADDIDLNGGAVTTTGSQTYTGPVTLGADTTLVASGTSAVITMASSVNSATATTRALTLTAGGTGGNVVLASTVGATQALSTLAVTASDIDLNGAAVTTTSSQTYTGPVTLGANTTLTGVGIGLTSTLKSDAISNRSLTLNDSGTTTLGGAIGGALGSATLADQLSSLTTDAAGTTAINGGSITTTGAQTFNDAVSFGAPTTLTGSTVTTLGTVAGNAKTLSIAGNAVFGDAPADTVTGLSSLQVSGSTEINASDISSTGSQTYTGAVTLGANTTLAASDAAAVITLASSVNSASTTTRALTISASGTGGNAVIGSTVGATNALSSLAVTASDIDMNGGGVTTTTSQTYTGPVTLGLDTTLSGVGITLGSTVKSDGTHRSLAINDSGTTTLGGAIGGSSAAGDKLSSITTNAGGTTAINGGSIATTGSQTFNDAVTLSVDTTLAATDDGVAITLATTVNSATTTPSALTLTASGAGSHVVLGGTVGTAKALSSLAVTASGIDLNGSAVTTTTGQTYTGPVTLGADTTLTGVGISLGGTVMSNSTARSLSIVDSGSTVLSGAVGGSAAGEELSSLITNASGSTTLNGGSVRTSGAQTYGDALTLGVDTTLAASDAAAVITLASSVNSASTTPRALTVTAAGAGGNVVIGSTVGATHAMSSLAVTASDIDLNGAAVTTTGSQTYTGPVTLGADTTLAASGAAAVITMASSVNSATATTRALTLTAGGTGGNVVLSSTVGATQALSTLAVTASDIDLNGAAVTTTSSQTYTGPVTLGANTTLTGVDIGLTSTLKSDAISNRSLTLNDSGTTTLGGAIGGALGSATLADQLSSLTTDAAGTTAIQGGSITTTGAQTFNDAVSLGLDTTLSGVGITLGSTVKSDGTHRSLAINDSGATTLGGAIGGSSAAGDKLSSITTNAGGTTAINGGSIATTGSQNFNDAVTLSVDTTLAATDDGVAITLATTVNSATTTPSALTLTASGAGSHVVLGGTVGTAKALSSLAVTASGIDLNGSAVTTTTGQTYTGPVTLGADTTLTGVGISLGGTVMSNSTARSLSIVDSGSTVLSGAVGGSAAGEELSSLITNASGSTTLNGGSVRTSGAQTYGDALTLGVDTTLAASDAAAVITLASSVNSASTTPRALTVTAAGAGGNVVIGSTVGATHAMSSLAVTASDIDLNGAAVTTTGSQTYTGPVTLGADTTLAASGAAAVITMASSVNSATATTRALTLTAGGTGGNVVLSSTVGATQALSTLAVTASDIDLNGAAVTTTSSQTYTGPVTLGANTTLTGVDIGLTSTLKSDAISNRSLTLNDSGTTTLGGAIGGALGSATLADQLSSLTTDAAGTTAIQGGSITTTGAQTFNDAVSLGAPTTLTGTTIGTRGTVVGNTNALTITGNAELGDGATDTVIGLGALSVSGTTLIRTTDIGSSGTQTYGGALTLAENTTLTGSTVTSQGTVTGTGSNSLAVAGNAVLGNSTSDTVSGLTSLSVTGTSAINTTAVTTSGSQTYTGAATLGADTTLTGAGITLGSTLKSDGTARSLSINDSATTTFNGAVGGTGADGTDGERLASLATDAVGTTAIHGGSVRSSGAQTYGDAVTLGAGTALAGSTISTLSTVAGNNHALTITGNAVLGDGLADALTGLSSLSISGTTALNVNAVSTSGTQTYGGALSLSDNTTLTGSTVTTQGTVAGGSKALTITGNAVLGNSTDDTVSGLTTLAVSGSTALTTGAITSSGAQTYTGAVTLGTDTTLTGSTITTQDVVVGAGKSLSITGNAVLGNGAADTVTGLSSLAISGTTTLGSNAVTSTGTQTYAGAVTLAMDTTLTGSTITTQAAVAANNKSLTITGNAVLGTGAADTVTGVTT
jgi:mucin-19